MSESDFALAEEQKDDALVIQHLTFVLGTEVYAVDILCIEEIKSGETITRIPRTPDYIKGVMNLRGTIVPIVDLRERFGITPSTERPVDVVIILTVKHSDGQRTVGAIVDDVSDVLALPEDEIKPSPDLGSSIDTEFIRGIATVEDQIVILLNPNRLFSLEELTRMEKIETAVKDDDNPEED